MQWNYSIIALILGEWISSRLLSYKFISCCSDGSSMEEDIVKLMKVAWMSVPLGLVITVVACFLVFWWQDISVSGPQGQAILINGNFLNFMNSFWFL